MGETDPDGAPEATGDGAMTVTGRPKSDNLTVVDDVAT